MELMFCSTTLHVELEVVKVALQRCRSLGLDRVSIATDAREVVQLVGQDASLQLWKFRAIIQDIVSLKAGFSFSIVS